MGTTKDTPTETMRFMLDFPSAQCKSQMGKAAGYTPRKMCDNQQAVEVVNLFKYWN